MPRTSVINPDELLAAVEECICDCATTGFCTACGSQQEGCEPDARNYECESCGEMEVFGAEELLIMGVCVRVQSLNSQSHTTTSGPRDSTTEKHIHNQTTQDK